MNNSPFNKPGTFYRGNLHTHTVHSDGTLTPEVVCQMYRENGYDFLSITDHFLSAYDYPIVDTRDFRIDDFTTIIGAELHTGRTQFDQLWHVLAVGLPLDFARPTQGETGPEIAQRAKAAGAFVAVAHPQWYALTSEDVLSLGDVHAIEVYNGISADHNDRADSIYTLDDMLNRGKRYNLCATDDAHFTPEKADFMRGWVWVKSEALTPESILAALKAGYFYSSTGPRIHDVQIEPGNKVKIRCSPASRIFVTGAGWEAKHNYGNGIWETEFSLEGWRSSFLRVTVVDRNGGRAWSNPFWFD